MYKCNKIRYCFGGRVYANLLPQFANVDIRFGFRRLVDINTRSRVEFSSALVRVTTALTTLSSHVLTLNAAAITLRMESKLQAPNGVITLHHATATSPWYQYT